MFNKTKEAILLLFVFVFEMYTYKERRCGIWVLYKVNHFGSIKRKGDRFLFIPNIYKL